MSKNPSEAGFGPTPNLEVEDLKAALLSVREVGHHVGSGGVQRGVELGHAWGVIGHLEFPLHLRSTGGGFQHPAAAALKTQKTTC